MACAPPISKTRSIPSQAAVPNNSVTGLGEAIEIFGPSRCLFGSNFPVEKLWTQYSDLIAAYRGAIEPLGEAAARAAFHDTAAKVYRLN